MSALLPVLKSFFIFFTLLQSVADCMHYMGDRHRITFAPCHCVVAICSEISFVTNTMMLTVEPRAIAARITYYWDFMLSAFQSHGSGTPCLSEFANPSHFMLLNAIWRLTFSFSLPYSWRPTLQRTLILNFGAKSFTYLLTFQHLWHSALLH